MKTTLLLGLICVGSFVGCGKDKTLEDYQDEQLQTSISRIDAISGNYSGSATSKLDGGTLGAVTLKFQSKTDIASTASDVNSHLNVAISGTLAFQGLTQANMSFDNGYYNSKSGNLTVTIPVTLSDKTTSQIVIAGQIANDNFKGTIQVTGQDNFGANLNLSKNASSSGSSSIEVGGIRMQQINKTSTNFEGTYKTGNDILPVKLSFIKKDKLPAENLYRLLSPTRPVSLVFDFIDFQLNFDDAILDDSLQTIIGTEGYDQKNVPTKATFTCISFDSGKQYGYDCQIQTRASVIALHLFAK